MLYNTYHSNACRSTLSSRSGVCQCPRSGSLSWTVCRPFHRSACKIVSTVEAPPAQLVGRVVDVPVIMQVRQDRMSQQRTRARLGAYTDRRSASAAGGGLASATNLGDSAALSTAPLALRRELGVWTSRPGFDFEADGGRVRPLWEGPGSQLREDKRRCVGPADFGKSPDVRR